MTSSPAYTNDGAPTGDEAFAMQLSLDFKREYDDENLGRAIELNDEEATLLRVKNKSRQDADARELERVKKGSLGISPSSKQPAGRATCTSCTAPFTPITRTLPHSVSRTNSLPPSRRCQQGNTNTPPIKYTSDPTSTASSDWV